MTPETCNSPDTEAQAVNVALALKLWKQHGGGQYGPHTETLDMPLDRFSDFITAFVAAQASAPALPQDIAKLIAEYRPSMPTEVLHLWAEDAKAALTAQSSTIASAREVIDGLLKALKVVEFRSYEPGEATDDEKTIRFEARQVVVAARAWME